MISVPVKSVFVLLGDSIPTPLPCTRMDIDRGVLRLSRGKFFSTRRENVLEIPLSDIANVQETEEGLEFSHLKDGLVASQIRVKTKVASRGSLRAFLPITRVSEFSPEFQSAKREHDDYTDALNQNAGHPWVNWLLLLANLGVFLWTCLSG